MGKNMNKKVIVVSAINIFEGGPLSILIECLSYTNNLNSEYIIYALVHNKNTFINREFQNVKFIEFPKSRNNYFFRIYYEYFYFKKLSKKLNPYLWFSLHDITPNVISVKRAVYCHNPTPFKKIKLSDLYFQPTIFIFNLFYKYLYKINIKKNDFVIVQQKWLKHEFKKIFELDDDNVLVCYPKTNIILSNIKTEEEELKKNICTFFYPALARPFKNFEVICEATSILIENGVTNFEIILTINGQENKYSKYIFKKFKHIRNIKFIGKINFDQVNEYYRKTNALIFPSTLETWGLPISEFKAFQKPILLSNLPYAKETIGIYEKSLFFNPENPKELSLKMLALINNQNVYDNTYINDEKVLIGWEELFDEIL